MESSDFVPVFVPRGLVADVYRLIVDHSGTANDQNGPEEGVAAPQLRRDGAQAQAAGAGSSPYITDRGADLTWPDAVLRQAYEESRTTMRGVLDYMADRPDEWCTTGDFADALGFTGERGIWRIPGILGAFTKRMKSRYERDFWPFSWRKDEEGRFWYSMPAPVAAKIRSFRQAA